MNNINNCYDALYILNSREKQTNGRSLLIFNIQQGFRLGVRIIENDI